MLELKGITKIYGEGDTKVDALIDATVSFRDNEFVSILGASGCGKTTMLNIIGGLDRYTEGDLVINGKSTKEYKARDWDTYRNHTIGFVFQSYNLITHQSVLKNVELALTLSGVSASERKKRALDALERVGLQKEVNKRPNQLSGGQMQRVAIARALVNNPDILLADEPTGALDSATSEQIMELLKEVAKDKLVIMVTHNKELADKYSTRIIKLLDGRIIDDTNPYTVSEEEKTKAVEKTEKQGKVKNTSMSFFTAIGLSARNLITKKTRTILTAIAGSIGIIGIALILAMSTGFQIYIDKMQADTLSTYPMTISKTTLDLNSLTDADNKNKFEEYPTDDTVKVNRVMARLSDGAKTNNMNKIAKDFIPQIDSVYYNDIQYMYKVNLNIYNKVSKSYGGTTYDVYYKVQTGSFMEAYSSAMNSLSDSSSGGVFGEMMNNADFIKSQYDVLDGRLPEAYNELVLIVDKYNSISDYVYTFLGMEAKDYKFNELIGKEFMLVSNDALYTKDGDAFKPNYNTVKASGLEITTTSKDVFDSGVPLRIVGIIRINDKTSTGAISSEIGYTSKLTEFVMGLDGFDSANVGFGVKSEIVNYMRAHELVNPYTGAQYTEVNGETPESQYNEELMKLSGADKDGNKQISSISIFPKDYEAKKYIKQKIEDYNAAQTVEEDKITYTDIMEVMMSAIGTAIDAISYVLIAFTSVSLVVSSIMIGIITYVSVIERTKEIGILRSVGARRKDIKRVFTAESMIIGFVAGLFGVLVTALLTIPINIILHSLTGVSGIAYVNPLHALLLVAISTFLTFIAGTVPSNIAAKKDPVEALRTE